MKTWISKYSWEIFWSGLLGGFLIFITIIGLNDVKKQKQKENYELQECVRALKMIHTAQDTIAIYTANHNCLK